MPAYATAILWNVDLNNEIVEYLERIDGTLAPFGGKFIVHGAAQQVFEGPADANLIVIEFPDFEAAQGWHDSADYQAIVRLRTDNCASIGILAPHCGENHVATDVLKGVAIDS
ncbi:DUF1330 domain-containing protein [Nocardia sp. NBC_00511]|uniref:DUF1330 domain-containing protein n=1 Tax=Nocardia sp. NBC_00511 TaxID=2903591 RepID=UPI0030DEC469